MWQKAENKSKKLTDGQQMKLLLILLEPILHPQSSSLSARTVLITLLLSAATQLVSLAGQGRIKPEKFEIVVVKVIRLEHIIALSNFNK